MELQEIYTTVVRHLTEQNARSVNKYDGGAYNGLNNMHCAVGVLFKDLPAEKISVVETQSVSEYKVLSLLIESGVIDSTGGISNPKDDVKICLLLELQDIHDNFKVADWPLQFRNVADTFNLMREAA